MDPFLSCPDMAPDLVLFCAFDRERCSTSAQGLYCPRERCRARWLLVCKPLTVYSVAAPIRPMEQEKNRETLKSIKKAWPVVSSISCISESSACPDLRPLLTHPRRPRGPTSSWGSPPPISVPLFPASLPLPSSSLLLTSSYCQLFVLFSVFLFEDRAEDARAASYSQSGSHRRRQPEAEKNIETPTPTAPRRTRPRATCSSQLKDAFVWS